MMPSVECSGGQAGLYTQLDNLPTQVNPSGQTEVEILSADLEQARRHLHSLDSTTKTFIFQTFDDSKDRKDPRLAQTFHGTIDEHAGILARLNRQGAGIYVTVNCTRNGSRKKEDITAARAMYREADTPDLPPLPVEPHLVIETSPGKKQEYIMHEPTTDFESWEGILQTIVDEHGGDPGAKGRNRVLRLAGFHHMKDPLHPHQVKIIHESGAEQINLDELAKVIPPARRNGPATADRIFRQPKPPAGEMSAYARAALDGEVEKVRLAAEGLRNDTLNRAAFALGQLVAGGEISTTSAETALFNAAMAAGLPEEEAMRTIQSGMDGGSKEPRQAPETRRKSNSTTAADFAGLGQYPEQSNSTGQSLYHRFGFMSASDMVREIRPTDWLIQDILEAQALSLMFGDPGTYKSFAALSMCLSVATGTPWHGRPVKQGLVVIVIGEGRNGYAKRMQAWSNVTGVSLDTTTLMVSNAPARILDLKFCDHLVKLIEEMKVVHGDPVLFTLDTLARNFGPGDENSTADMTTFINNLDGTLGNNCHRLIVHHSGHTAKDRGRGSSALKGAVDVEIMLEKTRDLVKMTCGKMKDAPPFPPMSFKPTVVDVLTTDPFQPDTSIFLEETEPVDGPTKGKQLSASALMALTTLEGIIGERDSVHLEEWRTAFYSRSTADNQGAKQKAFVRARSELATAQKIECRDDHYWPFVVLGQIRTNPDNV